MSRRRRVLLWAGGLVVLASVGLVGVRWVASPRKYSVFSSSVYKGPPSLLTRLRCSLGL